MIAKTKPLVEEIKKPAGPATTPQSRYEVRVNVERIEVRRDALVAQ